MLFAIIYYVRYTLYHSTIVLSMRFFSIMYIRYLSYLIERRVLPRYHILNNYMPNYIVSAIS